MNTPQESVKAQSLDELLLMIETAFIEIHDMEIPHITISGIASLRKEGRWWEGSATEEIPVYSFTSSFGSPNNAGFLDTLVQFIKDQVIMSVGSKTTTMLSVVEIACDPNETDGNYIVVQLHWATRLPNPQTTEDPH